MDDDKPPTEKDNEAMLTSIPKAKPQAKDVSAVNL